MKWMFFMLIAASISAHYWILCLDWSEQRERDKMNFTIEMSKLHPVFIHPLQSEDK